MFKEDSLGNQLNNMRVNLGKKSCIFPMPVLIIGTYDKDENPNAMNAAWGGIYDTNQIFICLSTDHKTTENIMFKKEFTVSFADESNMVASDYVGIETGNKVNKIEKVGWHHKKSDIVDAPLFDEFPVSIECRVNHYKEENGTTYVVADILNVSVDESLCVNGKFDSSKFHPISFDSIANTYRVLGDKVGDAFKEGEKIK